MPGSSRSAPDPSTSTSTGDPAAPVLDHTDAGDAPGAPAPETPPAELDGTHEPAGAGASPPAWRASLVASARALLRWRGLRCTVLGTVLTTIAVALGIGSAVSVSILVLGVVFLLIGVLGPRLQGRFSVEFGPDGASIDLRTQMAPPGSAWLPRALPPTKPAIGLSAPTRVTRTTSDAALAASLPGDVIEAPAETIELDTRRLRALLAVPQNGNAPTE